MGTENGRGRVLKSRLAAFNGKMQDAGIWMIFIVMFLLLSFVTDKFFTPTNLINVVRQIAVTSIASLGAVFAIFGGEIDLSQGNLAALTGCMCAILMKHYGYSTPVAIAASLVVAAMFGFFVGYLVAVLKVPAFIATLGMQYVYQGLTLVITNSQPITGLPDGFTIIGRGYLFGLPIPTIILAVLFAIGFFIFRYTCFGRNVISTGENYMASKLSGINVVFTKIMIFVISSLMGAVAGIVLTARLASGQPTAASDLSLQAISAVFVGGTAGGNVFNTLGGALVIGLINNGLNMMGVNAYWQKFALGAIIVFAVSLDAVRKKGALNK